jgi:transcriptional regulator with XRE-family HTH domain
MFAVIPAQVRAGRALLDWSQERLAEAAGVGLSTVRDLESQKRATDTAAAGAIRLALENEGVAFVSADAGGGAGVRLAASRPTLLRRPTVLTKWDGLALELQSQGRPITAFVSYELLADLGRLNGDSPPQAFIDTFEANRGRILDAVGWVMFDKNHYDQLGRLHVRSQDLNAPPANTSALTALAKMRWVQLRPLPKRIWRGEAQEPADYEWAIDRVDQEQGEVVITNPATGHVLRLTPAHIRKVLPGPRIVHSGLQAAGLLELAVQLVFEDGQMRFDLR